MGRARPYRGQKVVIQEKASLAGAGAQYGREKRIIAPASSRCAPGRWLVVGPGYPPPAIVVVGEVQHQVKGLPTPSEK